MSAIHNDLHERDFYTWTRRQAEALRRVAKERVNTAEPVDWANVALEIEGMGREQVDKLESAYRILLLHLLKWALQPDHRSASWRGSVVEHRRRALRLIALNPGLEPRRARLYLAAYANARAQAAAETELPAERFPQTPPFTLGEALADGFLPEAEA